MQKLYVESLLPVSPEAAWEVFESDAFRTRLREHTGMTSEVLVEREEGAIQVCRLKFVSGNDLPALVAKALGAKRLSYEQENRFDAAASKLDWIVELPMLGERVNVCGCTHIEPHPGGARRVVDGTIEVKMRFVGKQIEKAVVAEFEKSMRRAVEIALEMMNDLPKSKSS